MNHGDAQPLKAIIGYTALLQRDNSLASIQADMCARSGQRQRFLDLVNNLLDLFAPGRWQKVAKSQFPSRLTWMELGVKPSVVKPMAEDKRISITLGYPSALPTILWRSQKGDQILVNLLSQCNQVHNPTTVLSPCRLRRIDALRHEPESAVTDTGLASQADLFHNIFDRFVRAERAESRTRRGPAGAIIARIGESSRRKSGWKAKKERIDLHV